MPAESPDRELIEDTLFIMKRTLDNMVGSTVATSVSHNIYERLLTQERDSRRTLYKLDSRKLALARLGPIDSDTYVFGSQRDPLKQHILQKIDEHKQIVIAKPTMAGVKPFNKPGQGGQNPGFKKPSNTGKPGSKANPNASTGPKGAGRGKPRSQQKKGAGRGKSKE